LAFFFQEGLAILPKIVNGSLKFCYINPDGKEIIPPKYDRAQLFVCGMAAVMLNDKWGIINSKGETVVPFNYDYLEILNENYFVYNADGKSGVIDKTQSVIIKPEYSAIKFITDDIFALLPYSVSTEKLLTRFGFEPNDQIMNWGAINCKTGQQILPFDYHYIKKINSLTGSGIKCFVDGVSKEKEDSNILYNYNLTSAIPYFNCLVSAKQSVFNKEQIIFTFTSEPVLQEDIIQVDIKTVTDLQSIALSETDHPFFYTGKEWLNGTGQQVTDSSLLKQLNSRLYLNQLIIFTDETETKKGVKDLNNRIILEQEYDEIQICFSGIIICKNELFGFTDLAGRIIVPLIFENLKELPSGCLATEVNYKRILIDKAGKMNE